MKIQVPISYKEIKITKSNQFIAKNDKKEIFVIELPIPTNKWWIDGYYIDEEFIEIILIDANKNRKDSNKDEDDEFFQSVKLNVNKSFFAVVPKNGNENTEKELLLATTKKQAVILYKHWHYIFGRLSSKLCVKEFKIQVTE